VAGVTDSQPVQVIFFLDANVLISAAWKANAEVAGIWQLQGVRLVTSIYVMAEVQRNLPEISQIERLRRLMTSVEILLFPDLHEEVSEALLQLPQKDRPVLFAAIQARANFLITGDKKHFSQWFGMTIDGVRIEPPTNLLKLFRLRS
jgi:predicted nucleic acid-binding protein